MTSIKIKKNHAEVCDDVRIHSDEPDEEGLITAQVLIVFVVIVFIAFGIGLAIGGFYF